MDKIRGEHSEIQIPDTPSLPDQPVSPENVNLDRHFRSSLPVFSETPDFNRGSRSGGTGYSLIAWSFMAALIDSLVLFSIACFFLFSFSVLVKVRVLSAVSGVDQWILSAGLLCGASLIWGYMIMLRVFLGFTIGEWACGLRLGSLKQRLNRLYSLRVVARVVLIFATGFFVMPALSLLFGRDIPGLIVRLPLVSLGSRK